MCEVVKERHIVTCEQLSSLLCFLLDNIKKANAVIHEAE